MKLLPIEYSSPDSFKSLSKRMQHVVAGCLLWIGIVFGSTFAFADFGIPTPITDVESTATDTALAIDIASNIYVLGVVDNQIQQRLFSPGQFSDLSVVTTEDQESPDIGLKDFGGSFLVFTQLEIPDSNNGSEIKLAQNTGSGGYDTISNISLNSLDDYSPKMALGPGDIPQMVWVQRDRDGLEPERVVYYNHESQFLFLVQDGSEPDIGMEGIFAHMVYTRNGDLFYNTTRNLINPETLGFDFEGQEIQIVDTPAETESEPSIVAAGNGDIFIVYRTGNSVFFTFRRGNTDDPFSTPSLLDTGNISDPKICSHDGTNLGITYIKDDQVYYIKGVTTSLDDPKLLEIDLKEPKSKPHMMIDPGGSLHLSYLQDNVVYYTNSTQTLFAEFDADPRSGEAPMTVQFQDLSVGEVVLRTWEFGDGTFSSQINPEHTYQTSGSFNVKLTVSNASQIHQIQKEAFIIVQEPSFTMEIPDMLVVPGQTGLKIPVIGTYSEPIRGFQIVVTYNTSILEYVEFIDEKGVTICDSNLEGTITAGVNPELVACNSFLNRPRVEVGCLFDIKKPFEDKTLPPTANGQVIWNFIFNVKETAPVGAVTSLKLDNITDIADVLNIYTVGQVSIFPALESSRVEVVDETALFIRGDANGDDRVNLPDAQSILNWLFLGGSEPSCLDGADVNDLGNITIAEAVTILNFLFVNGRPPAPPFPDPGVDPTEDEYGCN